MSLIDDLIQMTEQEAEDRLREAEAELKAAENQLKYASAIKQLIEAHLVTRQAFWPEAQTKRRGRPKGSHNKPKLETGVQA